MSLFQILVGFVLVALWAARPFLYKPAARHFKPEVSSLFTSCWLLVGLIVSFPMLGHLLNFNNQNALLSPYILISIYKGITLFYLVAMQQAINKSSTSSSVFLGFMALALGAVTMSILPATATRQRELHKELGTTMIVPHYQLDDLKDVIK